MKSVYNNVFICYTLFVPKTRLFLFLHRFNLVLGKYFKKEISYDF